MQKTVTCKRKQKKISKKVHFSTKKKRTHYYKYKWNYRHRLPEVICPTKKNGVLSPDYRNFKLTKLTKKKRGRIRIFIDKKNVLQQTQWYWGTKSGRLEDNLHHIAAKSQCIWSGVDLFLRFKCPNDWFCVWLSGSPIKIVHPFQFLLLFDHAKRKWLWAQGSCIMLFIKSLENRNKVCRKYKWHYIRGNGPGGLGIMPSYTGSLWKGK